MSIATLAPVSPTAARMASIEKLAKALLAAHVGPKAGYGWRFVWDTAIKRGGQCSYNRRTISLSRNLAPRWSFEEVHEVILHEIAHAVAGHSAGHGPEWRRIALSIGSNGKRCHQSETATERMRWTLDCPTHGTIAHRQRRPRQIFVCRDCRQGLRVNENPEYGTARAIEPTREEVAEWDAKCEAAIAAAQQVRAARAA